MEGIDCGPCRLPDGRTRGPGLRNSSITESAWLVMPLWLAASNSFDRNMLGTVPVQHIVYPYL